MLASPAVRNEWVETSDLDEAHTVLRRTYVGRHSLHEVASPGKRFGLRHRVVSIDQLNIGLNTFSADVRVAIPPIESGYIACFAVSGGVHVCCGPNSADLCPGRIVVFPPNHPVQMEHWVDGSCIAGIWMSRTLLEGALSRLLGRPVDGEVEFSFDTRDVGRDGTFLRTVQFIMAELSKTETDGCAGLSAVFSELLVNSLLTTQYHNYSRWLADPESAMTPPAITRAVDYIHANPAAIMTVAQLAKVAAVSVRSLEYGFKSHLGMSPMAYLRDVRLGKVHQELSTADPSTISVTTVAGKWGFNHMGRFGDAYRRRYGALPSETLKHGGKK